MKLVPLLPVLFSLLLIPVQSVSDDRFCDLISWGSFFGKFSSVTWWGEEQLAVVVQERIYLFNVPRTPSRDIVLLDARRTDTHWERDKASEAWVDYKPLRGLYKLSPLKVVDNQIKVVMDGVNMMVVQQVNDSAADERFQHINWWQVFAHQWEARGSQLLLSRWQHYDCCGRPRGNPPTIIHDVDEEDVWSWMTYYDRTLHQTLIHSFHLKGEFMQISEEALERSYYLTFADGRMILYRHQKHVPVRASPFDDVPRGFVYRKSGSLFLFDESAGCVYIVTGWNRTDLWLSGANSDMDIMNFNATGKPLEKFFRCPAGSKEKLDANRCRLGAGLRTSKFNGAARGGEVPEYSVRGGFFTFMLIGGALIVAAIMGVTAFKCLKKGGGAKSGSLGGSGKSGKSKSTGKSSGKSSTFTATSSGKQSGGPTASSVAAGAKVPKIAGGLKAAK